jgi:hypothetical protein
METVREERLRWMLRAAALLHERGAEPVSGLVLPNNEFFPDAFDGTPKAVERLLGRMLGYAGLSDVTCGLQIVTPEGEVQKSGGCGSGGCAKPMAADGPTRRVERSDDGYTVTLSAGEARHATLLTTALARATAAVFLGEAELDEDLEGDPAAWIDACGAMLGFGVLLANGSHILSKGCGGVTVHSATTLPVEEITVLLAAFCQLYGISARTAKGELDAEPRRHFDEAAAWAKANGEVLALCTSDRRAVERDAYRLAPARSWLARLFARRTADAEPTEADLQRAAAPRDSEKARRMAALRDLVDESLD